MQNNHYISASCIISNNAIVKNGKTVFADEAASPNDFFLAAYRHFQLNYSRFHKMDSLSKLGWLACEILLQNDFDKSAYSAEKVGVVLSNANSSLDSDKKYMASVADIPSPALFVYTLPNIMIGEICIRNNFKGEDAFFVFEKFNAGFIKTYVDDLLNGNSLSCCICGWVDLLDDNYKAVLYLVEKKQAENAVLFSAKNMDSIFDANY